MKADHGAMINVAGHDIHVTNQNLVVFQPTGKVRHKDGTTSGGNGAGSNHHLPIWKKDDIEYVTFDGGISWVKVFDVPNRFFNAQISREIVNRG